MISKYDLSEEQWEKVETLANDTLPQGQFFWVQAGDIFVEDNQLFELWEAQGGDRNSLINFSTYSDEFE